MSFPSLDGTGRNSYLPHIPNPKRNRSTVNAEAQIKSPAAPLPNSFQYQRLLWGKNHNAIAAPVSKRAVMRSSMPMAGYHRPTMQRGVPGRIIAARSLSQNEAKVWHREESPTLDKNPSDCEEMQYLTRYVARTRICNSVGICVEKWTMMRRMLIWLLPVVIAPLYLALGQHPPEAAHSQTLFQLEEKFTRLSPLPASVLETLQADPSKVSCGGETRIHIRLGGS